MEQTLGLREPAPGHLGQHQPLQQAAPIGVYPPRVCPTALPTSISRYNTARPPLPTEHSASCEGKVETPVRRSWEGLIKPRSGVSGWPLPPSRRRPGTAKAASTGSGTGRVQAPNSTPWSRTGPAPGPSHREHAAPSRVCRPQPGNGDPPGHAGCGMPGPGSGTAAIRDAAAEPGGTRAVAPAAQPRDPPDAGTAGTGTPERHRRGSGSYRSAR